MIVGKLNLPGGICMPSNHIALPHNHHHTTISYPMHYGKLPQFLLALRTMDSRISAAISFGNIADFLKEYGTELVSDRRITGIII